MTSAEMHKAVSTAKIEASIQEERNISAMVKIPLDFDNLDLTQRKDCSRITIFMCYVGKRFFKRWRELHNQLHSEGMYLSYLLF